MTKQIYNITIREILETEKLHNLKVTANSQDEANEKALNYMDNNTDVEVIDVELQTEDCTTWEIWEDE